MLFYKICLGFIWIQIYFHSTKISYAMQKAHMCVCASGEGGWETKLPRGPWAGEEGPKKHFRSKYLAHIQLWKSPSLRENKPFGPITKVIWGTSLSQDVIA